MPSPEELDQILAIATTEQDLAYFFDQLQSPTWIPSLRLRGLFESPPEPVEKDGGIGFPGWPQSRYLARVAARDPDLVMSVLLDIRTTTNPRVSADVLEALAAMPAPYSVGFLPEIRRWVHSPFQLGAEDQAAKIGTHLVAAALVGDALSLLETMAALVPPAEDAPGPAWAPLGDWDYGRLVPRLAAEVAAQSIDGVWGLADTLDAAVVAKADEVGGHSSFWRPAIENHPQNWGHHPRPEALLEAIRDSSLRRIDAHPEELRPIVEGLLRRSSAILKRVAIYLLAERGHLAPDLAGAVLAMKELFANTELHHEFYRLASEQFGAISDADRVRYLELVDEVAQEKAEDGDPATGAMRAKWWARNRLGPVADWLDEALSDRYDALVAEMGLDDHPDFLMWHESWSGPISPLSRAELDTKNLDELAEFLATYRTDEEWGPRPSRDGLARELQAAAAADPVRYAPFAERLITLPPIYAGWFLLGLRDALKGEATFDLRPVVALCHAVIERSRSAETGADGSGDDSWSGARIDVARFLEDALARRRLADDDEGLAWASISELLRDPDPSAASEVGFGDPVTHSMNSTRGQALHAALAYAWWSWRRAPGQATWRLSEAEPDVARALEEHISPDGDPAEAVGAAYGWWLEALIGIDAEWVREHAGALLGDLTTPRQRAAWAAYLMRSRPSPRNYGALREFYTRYADVLANLAEPPTDKSANENPVERFIAHLALLELHHELPTEGGPLEALLRSRRGWLLRELVKGSGRLAHDSGDLNTDLMAGFHALWSRIRAWIDAGGELALRAALEEFSWWFASKLPASWTLPELIDLLDLGVRVGPEFLVLPRLAEVAPGDQDRALRALEKMVPRTDEEWAFRAHESDAREILRIGLASPEAAISERARVLVNRFGRLGMVGLGTLLDAGDVSA
jgi:hypothetical protein